jgi:hypothetical protein
VLDASRALGASRWRTFFQVILPLSLPGWVAGATLVFASSVTAFISQSVIGGGRLVFLPSVIWQQSMVVYNWPFAAVAAVTLLVTVLFGIGLLSALGAHRRLVRRMAVRAEEIGLGEHCICVLATEGDAIALMETPVELESALHALAEQAVAEHGAEAIVVGRCSAAHSHWSGIGLLPRPSAPHASMFAATAGAGSSTTS